MGSRLTLDQEEMLKEVVTYYVFEEDEKKPGEFILVGNPYARDFDEYNKQIDNYGSFLNELGENNIPKSYKSEIEPHYSKNYRLLTEEEFNERHFARIKEYYTKDLKRKKEGYSKTNFAEVLKAMKLGVVMHIARQPGCPQNHHCEETWQELEIPENDKPAVVAVVEEFEKNHQTAGKRRRRNTKRRRSQTKKTRRH